MQGEAGESYRRRYFRFRETLMAKCPREKKALGFKASSVKRKGGGGAVLWVCDFVVAA